MGLDMYLTCNSKAVVNACDMEGDEPWRTVGGVCIYWRKMNAIHKWFVDKVQGGVDDCKTYEVTVEELKDLLDCVCYVLDGKDEERAKVVLPTMEGFFFGSMKYDEDYWDNLAYTREKLTRLLGSVRKTSYRALSYSDVEFTDWMPNGEDDWVVCFQYHSSW